MSLLNRYMSFAERSRRAGFSLPVVRSQVEALRVAARIAEAVAAVPETERLLFLTELADLRQVLNKRCEVLKDEIERNRAELARVTRTVEACNAYMLAASHSHYVRTAQQPLTGGPCP